MERLRVWKWRNSGFGFHEVLGILGFFLEKKNEKIRVLRNLGSWEWEEDDEKLGFQKSWIFQEGEDHMDNFFLGSFWVFGGEIEERREIFSFVFFLFFTWEDYLVA